MDEIQGMQAGEVLLAAVELPEAQRSGFLAKACAGDDALRRKVERMLAQYSAVEGFLETPATLDPNSFVEGVLDDAADNGMLVGRNLGKYEIVRLIGVGGMGIVYEARQESPRRAVALKVMRSGIGGRRFARRFQREAEVLGRLTHPGIARIYEADAATIDGALQPFFVMELVEGVPITQYAASLKTRAKLELMARVCDSVQHAHQKGVIHRDLKPGNVLVESSGQPKVLDFGIARATQDDVAQTMQTEIGQLIGTLEYMSPEQAMGRSGEIDTRADIYSLGVMLFELLTGRLPHNVAEKSIPDAVRTISEGEPARAGNLDRSLRGDVETILAKALENDKERRYQSAAEMAADIRRYLSAEPIAARPAGTFYQARKFAARNKGLVAGLAAAFLALSVGLGGATWQALLKTGESEKNERLTYSQTIRLAAAEIAADDLANAADSLGAAPKNLRDWEWAYLSSLSRGDATILDASHDVFSLAATSDGARIAAGLITGEILVWNRDRNEPTRLEGLHGGPIYAVAFSPDDKSLASGDQKGRLVVWDMETMHGRVIGSQSPDEASNSQVWGIVALAFAPDGRTVASAGGADKAVRIWDLTAPGTPLRKLQGESPSRSLSYLRDGRLLVGSDAKKQNGKSPAIATVSRWDVHVPQESKLLAAPAPIRGVFSYYEQDTNAEVVIAVDYNGTVTRIDQGRDDAPRPLATTGRYIQTAAMSPAGDWIVVSDDRRALVRDAKTGQERKKMSGHAARIWCACFVGKLPLVATGSLDGTVRISRISAEERPFQLVAERAWHLNSPQRGYYITATKEGRIEACHFESRNVRTLAHDPSETIAASTDRPGAWGVLGSREGKVRLFELSTGTVSATFEFGEPVTCVAVCERGTLVAGGTQSGRTCVWRVADRHLLGECKGETMCTALQFSPDGRHLLAGFGSGEVVSLLEDRQLKVAHFTWDPVSCIAFSDQGDLVAIGLNTNASGNVRLLDVGSWQERQALGIKNADSRCAVFSRSGRRLVTGDSDSKVRVYALNDSKPLIAVQLPANDAPTALSYSPDGALLGVLTQSGKLLEYGDDLSTPPWTGALDH